MVSFAVLTADSNADKRKRCGEVPIYAAKVTVRIGQVDCATAQQVGLEFFDSAGCGDAGNPCLVLGRYCWNAVPKDRRRFEMFRFCYVLRPGFTVTHRYRAKRFAEAILFSTAAQLR